jgi:hypothetical protein
MHDDFAKAGGSGGIAAKVRSNIKQRGNRFGRVETRLPIKPAASIVRRIDTRVNQ